MIIHIELSTVIISISLP